MAEKRPLCQYSGGIEELRPGDSVPGGAGSSSSTALARNSVINKDPLSQAMSTDTGMESLLGTNTTQVTTTGGTNGFLRWTKDRNNAATSHVISDSIHGDTYIRSDTTAVKSNTVPAINSDDVTWTFKTRKKKTGNTSGGIAYETHYNPEMGFSIMSYQGALNGDNRVPHHLPLVGNPNWLMLTKNRDRVIDWVVSSNLISSITGGYMVLNTSAAKAVNIFNSVDLDSQHAQISGSLGLGATGQDHLAILFTEKPGVCEIGTYTGSGLDGNYIDLGFRPGFILIKKTNATSNWVLVDTARGDDKALLANLGNLESIAENVFVEDTGFRVDGADTDTNLLSSQYVYVAFAETTVDAQNQTTEFDYPTTGDTLTIEQDVLTSFAAGFDTTGRLDSNEVSGSGLTQVFGAGHESKHYWMYKVRGGSYGVTENKPLIGLTRALSDTWGYTSPVDSDLKTSVTHTQINSGSGSVAASGDIVTNSEPWRAFQKANITAAESEWRVVATTTSYLRYRNSEPRVLKSWRLRASSDAGTCPRRFTIEGSIDAVTWTAIDSTYTASDFPNLAINRFSEVQPESQFVGAANNTAHKFFRINITANHGDVTATEISDMEFNSEIQSDYYLTGEAKTFNNAAAAIEKVYLAEIITDSDGDVSYFTNMPKGLHKFETARIEDALYVGGDIIAPAALSAWCMFSTSGTPNQIINSYNVRSLVDVGTGAVEIIFKEPMDTPDYGVLGMEQAGSTSNPFVLSGPTSDVGAPTLKEAYGVRVGIAASARNTALCCLGIIGGKK